MPKEYKFGFIIEGNDSNGTKALRAVKTELEQLDAVKKKGKQSTDAWTEAQNNFGKKADTIRGLVVGLGATLGGVFTINYFKNLITGAIDAADNLNDLSKSTGVSVETLSGLQLAAKQSGTELEQVAKSMNFLSKGIGQNAEKYRELGITAAEPLEALKQLADKFVATTDIQERNAMAAAALGKQWETVAPLLAEGGDKIQEMVDKGQDLSKITTEMAQQADAYNDNMEVLKAATAGWATAITGALLPALVGASEWVLKLVDAQTWLEQQTSQANDRLAEQREQLKLMSAAEIDKELQTTFAQMEKLKNTVAGMRTVVELGTGAWAVSREELKAQEANLASVTQHYEDLKNQLAIIEGRAPATAEELDNTGDSTGDLSDKTRDLIAKYEQQNKLLLLSAREQAAYRAEIEAFNTGAGPEVIAKVREWALANYDLEASQRAAKESQEAVERAGREYVEYLDEQYRAALKRKKQAEDDAWNFLVNEVQDADAAIQKRNKEAAEQSEKYWNDFHGGVKQMLGGMIKDWQNLGDFLEDYMKTLGTNMLANFLGTGVTKIAQYMGLGPSPGKSSSGLLSSLGSIGSLFGKGGQAITAGQAAALNLPASAATGAGLLSTAGSALAAIPGWGWALAGVAAVAGLATKKSTPTSNAGFLLHDVAGASADRKFTVDPFASGFQPVGFSRREDFDASKELIDQFRKMDQDWTDLARSIGVNVQMTAANFRSIGTSETGYGDGVFVGRTSESGKLVDNTARQLNEYVINFVKALSPQVSADAIQRILAGTDAADMLRIAREEVARYTQTIAESTTARAKDNEAAKAEMEMAKAENAAAMEAHNKAVENRAKIEAMIKEVQDGMDALRPMKGIFADIADSGGEATSAMIELAGGLDKLIAKSKRFVELYYTDDEQVAIKAADVVKALEAVGLTQDAIGDLNTKSEFRALVNSLDPSKQDQRVKLNALLDLAPAFADLADALVGKDGRERSLFDLRSGVPAGAIVTNPDALQQAITEYEPQDGPPQIGRTQPVGTSSSGIPNGQQDSTLWIDIKNLLVTISTSTKSSKELLEQLSEFGFPTVPLA